MMKGVGGILDILTNFLTLIIGVIFIIIGWNNIPIPSFIIVLLGIAFIMFALFSFFG